MAVIGPIMFVNHLPNQVWLTGASNGPIVFLMAFGMARCAHSHLANEKQPKMVNEKGTLIFH